MTKYKSDAPLYEFDQISLMAGRMQGMETALVSFTETIDAVETMLEECEKLLGELAKQQGVNVIVFDPEDGDA